MESYRGRGWWTTERAKDRWLYIFYLELRRHLAFFSRGAAKIPSNRTTPMESYLRKDQLLKYDRAASSWPLIENTLIINILRSGGIQRWSSNPECILHEGNRVQSFVILSKTFECCFCFRRRAVLGRCGWRLLRFGWNKDEWGCYFLPKRLFLPDCYWRTY